MDLSAAKQVKIKLIVILPIQTRLKIGLTENQIHDELHSSAGEQTGEAHETLRVEIHDISMSEDNINCTEPWTNHSHPIVQEPMHSSYNESVSQHPQRSEYDASQQKMVPFEDMMLEASQVNPESNSVSQPMTQLNATLMGLPEQGQNPPIIGNNVTLGNMAIDTMHVYQDQFLGYNYSPHLNQNRGYFASLLLDDGYINQPTMGFYNQGNVGSTMIGPDSLSVFPNLNVGNSDENLHGYNSEHNALHVDPSLGVGNIAQSIHSYRNNQQPLLTLFGSGSQVHSGVSLAEYMIPSGVGRGNHSQWLNNMNSLPLHPTYHSSGTTATANMTNQSATDIITSYVGLPPSMGLSTRAHFTVSVSTRSNQTTRRRRQNQPQRSRNRRHIELGESSSRVRELTSQVTLDGEHQEQRSRTRRVVVTGESSRGATPRPRRVCMHSMTLLCAARMSL